MSKQRLEAFTDGVMAIVITIMVLDMKLPKGASLAALKADLPPLLGYALSYANVGIFWNNHHHVLHACEKINGYVLWANLLLLFWITLIPFVILWMDNTNFAPVPTASYGVVLSLSAVAYMLLEWALIRCNGPTSRLAQAVGNETKGKLSLALYLVAIAAALLRPWVALAIYVAVAMMWFIPDRRIESII